VGGALIYKQKAQVCGFGVVHSPGPI
jgi:hypothetical protein